MKHTGNLKSNSTYNPHNMLPSIPLDVDEVDAAMEKFLRQKYELHILSQSPSQQASLAHSQQRSVSSSYLPPRRQSGRGGSASSEGSPPPPPPKSSKHRFGLGSSNSRAISSAFPTSTSRRDRHHDSPPVSPRHPLPDSAKQPALRNKQSRVFGASVGSVRSSSVSKPIDPDSFEAKLERLREMGFPDEQRNTSVLKGLQGNLDRSVETLIRLGEGGHAARTKAKPSTSRSATSSATTLYQPPVAVASSMSQQNTGTNVRASNPFQRRATQPELQRQFDAANASHRASGLSKTYDPFETGPSNEESARTTPVSIEPTAIVPTPLLEQSFSSLGIGAGQGHQRLFPNATGGFPNQRGSLMQAQVNYSQPLTPPVPSTRVQTELNNYFASNWTSQAETQSAVNFAGNNPYLQQAVFNPSFGFAPSGQWQAQSQAQMQAQQPQFFVEGSSAIYEPYMPSAQYQPHSQLSRVSQPYVHQQQPLSFQPQPQSSFATHPPMSNAYYAQQQQVLQPQAQMLQPQATGRADKDQIMAMFNYPHLAPPLPIPSSLSNAAASQESQVFSQPQSLSNHAAPSGATPSAAHQSTRPVPSSAPTATATNPGSQNPFLQHPPPTDPVAHKASHPAQETVEAALAAGRHSPDAFASLSARSFR